MEFIQFLKIKTTKYPSRIHKFPPWKLEIPEINLPMTKYKKTDFSLVDIKN